MNKLQNLQKHERKGEENLLCCIQVFAIYLECYYVMYMIVLRFKGPFIRKGERNGFFFCKFSFSIIFRFFLLLRSGVHCIIDQQHNEITLDIRFSVFIDI